MSPSSVRIYRLCFKIIRVSTKTIGLSLMAAKPKPLFINRLIPERYYERMSRKRRVALNIFVGTTEYQFLSAGVEGNTLRCYYMRVG